MSFTDFGIDPAYSGDVNIPGPDILPDEMQRTPEEEGQWPPMLVLGEDTEARLKMWLYDELTKCYAERDEMIDEWEDAVDDYWANPESDEKNFPFRKAANVVIPLTAIAVEAVYARLINTIFSVEPFWRIRPKSKEWIDAAPFVEQWLQTEAENENALDVYSFCQDAIMEVCKLGTCVGKSGYEREIRKSAEILPDETRVARWVEVRNGATLDYVPTANFLIRINETDPQKASWCGEDHREVSWAELKRMSTSGRMTQEGIEAIKTFWGEEVESSGSSKEYHEKVEEELGQEPSWRETFTFQEIWASFDVDGDGFDEEIVIDYHYPSDTILSIRYNWYDDCHRPYRVANYFPVEGRIYGVGIAKQNEQFQEEITTIHRQRLDNATLANMRMIAVSKTSGYGPGENIFPGKIWQFDDPSRDFKEIQMTEIYPSSQFNESHLLNYSERRTAVNEMILGMPSEGTPATATSDIAKLQEGVKRFDQVMRNVRNFLSLLGKDVLANYQQFGDQQRHWTVMNAQGEWIERILQMPAALVRQGAIVDLAVSDSIANRQVQQQQWLALFQVITNYYTQRLELAAQITQAPQEAQEFMATAQAAIKAADEAFERLLDTYDIIDKDALLLNPKLEEGAGGPFASQQGRPGVAGGTQGTPGLEDILQAITQTGTRVRGENGGRGNAPGGLFG